MSDIAPRFRSCPIDQLNATTKFILSPHVLNRQDTYMNTYMLSRVPFPFAIPLSEYINSERGSEVAAIR